jgi:hypothetical protein
LIYQKLTEFSGFWLDILRGPFDLKCKCKNKF